MRHGKHRLLLRITYVWIALYPILHVPAILKSRPHHVLEVVLVYVIGIPVVSHLLYSIEKPTGAIKLVPVSRIADQGLYFCHHAISRCGRGARRRRLRRA
jgi:hypothetical protein